MAAAGVVGQREKKEGKKGGKELDPNSQLPKDTQKTPFYPSSLMSFGVKGVFWGERVSFFCVSFGVKKKVGLFG